MIGEVAAVMTLSAGAAAAASVNEVPREFAFVLGGLAVVIAVLTAWERVRPTLTARTEQRLDAEEAKAEKALRELYEAKVEAAEGRVEAAIEKAADLQERLDAANVELAELRSKLFGKLRGDSSLDTEGG